MQSPAFSPPKPWRRRARGLPANRRGAAAVIAVIIVALIAVSAGAYFFFFQKQQKPTEHTAKMHKVGILSGLDFFLPTADGFKAGMAELGYIEGKNVTYDLQKTNFDPQKEKAILEKFKSDKVDLVLTFPTEVSISAKETLKDTGIPLIFSNANIEDVGLIDSIKEPGGNVTGVRYPGPDLAIKRMEVLLEIVPGAKRIFIPYQEGYPNVAPQLKVLKPAAASSGITIIDIPFKDARGLENYLNNEANIKNFDAILMIPEPLTVTAETASLLDKFVDKNKTPLGGAIFPKTTGSLFGMTTNSIEVGKQAAVLADKVLKGQRAGTIPVISADGFLTVNYKTAQKIGAVVPEGLLTRAIEIIR